MRHTKTGDLARELVAVMKRGLDTVFVSGHRNDERVYPELSREVARIRPIDWQENPCNALGLVVRDAIDTLPDTTQPLGFELSWRALARLLCGLQNDLPPKEDGSRHSYNERCAVAKKCTVYGDTSTFNRRTGELRNKLADAMRSLPVKQTVPPLAADRGPISAERIYVRRPELESELTNALRTGLSPVVLWGETGNGKSVLARQVASELYRGVAVLRGPAIRDSLYEQDLIRLLNSNGMESAGWSLAAQELALQDLLHTGGGNFDAIILDNIDEPALARIVEQPLVPTVVTMRHRPVDVVDPIFVSEYSDSQALQAAAAAAGSNEANDQTTSLCRLLGNRPVAIDIAFRLIGDNKLGLEAMLDACRERPAATVQASSYLLDPPVEYAVVSVYQALLNTIKSDRSIVEVLETITWIEGSDELTSIIAICLAPGISPITDTLSIVAALIRLSELGVVVIDGDGVLMNDLTRDILRSITPDRLHPALERYYERFIATSEQPFDNIPESRSEGTSQLEQTAIRSDAKRRVVVADNLNFVDMLTLLAPTIKAGVSCVSERTWVAWQAGFKWFDQSDDDHHVALVEVFPDRIRISQHARYREQLTPDAARLFLVLVEAYDFFGAALMVEMATWNRGLPLDQQVVGGDKISLSMYEQEHDHQRHRPLSPIPLTIAARLEIPIWSACGRLYTPEVFRDPSVLKNCEICDAGSDGQLRVPDEVGSSLDFLCRLLRNLDDATGDAALIARIYSAQAVIARAQERRVDSIRYCHLALARVLPLSNASSQEEQLWAVYTSALLSALAVEAGDAPAGVEAVQTLCSALASVSLSISPLDAYRVWWPILDRHISFQGEERAAALLRYVCRDPLTFANPHGLTYASFEPYTMLLWNELVRRMNNSKRFEPALRIVDSEILPRLARLSGMVPPLDRSLCWFEASWANYGADNLRQAIEYAEAAMAEISDLDGLDTYKANLETYLAAVHAKLT